MLTKGMILAAGLGTRLRPVTYETPKPLIEVGGRKIVEFNLALLEKSGVTDVMINLYHLGEKIKDFLGNGSKYGLRISYSFEQEILGTGGGIKKVGNFFGNDPFVVINSDTLIDVRLSDLFAFHSSIGAHATMVVRKLQDGDKYSPVNVENSSVKGFGSGDMMYTGVQVLNTSVLGCLPEGVSDIVKDAYVPMLKNEKRIAAFVHDGFWTEIGTPEKLSEARRFFDTGALKFWYL